MAAETAGDLWTIAELADRVAAALAGNFDGVGNGRVRDVPDLRAIRYYTTIGLLDRPAEMRGRTAYYGRRHLVQLVAIKRLQSLGLALAQVQSRTLRLNDRQLERLAEVKSEIQAVPLLATSGRDSVSLARAKRKTPPRSQEFWRSAPAAAIQPDANDERPPPGARVVTLVPLAAWLSVGVEACRAMTAEDIAALRAAAEPVRQALIERRLIPPDPGKGS